MNLLDLARSAITEPPAKRTATPTEKSKLRGLLEVILAECPDEIEWSLGIACADVDDAFVCFQALAADRRATTERPNPPDANRKETVNGSV